MRILAIDHGTVRIGLAISDEMELVATPLMMLHNNKQFFHELRRIIRDRKVGKIIIGEPLHTGGERGKAIERVEAFATQLSKELNHEIPIDFIDERQSSKAAKRALLNDGHAIDPRDGLVDQLAATIILQDYLNTQRGPESFLLPDDCYDMPWMGDQPPPRKKRH